MNTLATHYSYFFYVAFMMIGLYAMIGKNNLVKKVIGMAIFQAAIVLFYVSSGVKTDATIPIVHHGEHHEHQGDHGDHGDHGHDDDEELESPEQVHDRDEETPLPADDHDHPPGESVEHAINTAHYMNPLPHVLMLTAIVVGVATLGVALALIQRLNAIYGTVEEDKILDQLRASAPRGSRK